MRYDRQAGGEHKDTNRGAGQVDRDRILTSYPFRRLAGITQIATANEHPLFHNRLTHSLEVAMIARRIAENLLEIKPNIDDIPDTVAMKSDTQENQFLRCQKKRYQWKLKARDYLDPDVVEAAALAHDLGHPPFGHIGEEELDNLVRTYSNRVVSVKPSSDNVVDQEHSIKSIGDNSEPYDEERYGKDCVKDGFEGNAQSFRIVTRLAHHHSALGGLNLTEATLNAILKYPWFYKPELSKKYGYYRSEERIFQKIVTSGRMKKGNNKILSKNLEAQIMDYADLVAYAVNDLNDFVLAGFITKSTLNVDSDFLIEAYTKQICEQTPDDCEDGEKLREIVTDRIDSVKNFIHRIEIETLDRIHPGYQICYKEEGNKEQKSLVAYFVNKATICCKGGKYPDLKIDDKAAIILQALAKVVKDTIHNNPKLLSQQHGQKKIIRFLFEEYMEILENKTKYALIPIQFRERVEKRIGSNKIYIELNHTQKKRLVADIVSSLTDAHAYKLFLRFSGAESGAITDLVML